MSQSGTYGNGGGGGSSGALILIQTQTASGVTSLSFTTGITSTYNNYQLFVTNYIASLTAQWLYLLISTDGGATYINTGYYTANGFGTGGLPGFQAPNLGGDSSTMQGELHLFDFTSSGYPSTYTVLGIAFDTTSPLAVPQSAYAGTYGTPVTVNAFQLIQDDGTAFSGTFSLYGLTM